MRYLTHDFYPPHLRPVNWDHGKRERGKGRQGRVITCLVCNMQSSTRTRRGDARFIKAHRRCALYWKGNT